MTKVTTVGLDLAKSVFHVHGADRKGRPVLRKKLRRRQVLVFFAELSPCLVGLEACASAHYWARELQALGHEVRLIPPQYVKPFVKTNSTGPVAGDSLGRGQPKNLRASLVGQRADHNLDGSGASQARRNGDQASDRGRGRQRTKIPGSQSAQTFEPGAPLPRNGDAQPG